MTDDPTLEDTVKQNFIYQKAKMCNAEKSNYHALLAVTKRDAELSSNIVDKTCNWKIFMN